MASGSLWRETPLIESPSLSKVAGCRVFLKLEALQPSGSFKSRGIGNYIQECIKSRGLANPQPHFYSSSGGNAGLACVVAARQLGYPATVIVPLTTKKEIIEKIKSRGATDVIQYGESWREADTYLREVILAADKRGVYVPPFDHEDIWEGNATLVDELWAQMNGTEKQVNGYVNVHVNGSANGVRSGVTPKAIVCSVGGGGLFCGIMRGLERYPLWSDVAVVAAETLGADSLHRSVKAGELVTLPSITSKATSLGATRVAEQCFAYAKEDTVRSVTVTDDAAAKACCFVADEERLLVELACGASVAVCFDGMLEQALSYSLKPSDSVVVVLCGGSNVSVDLLALWKLGSLVSQAAVNGHTNGHA